MEISQFEEIYRRLYRPLFLYASDFVSDAEACRDIVADVFMQLWEIFKDDNTIVNPEAFLRRCVRNAALNWLRHNNVHQEYARLMSLEETEMLQIDTVDERFDRLRVAIDLLPERTRTILEHCLLQKMTYKETGDLMGISANGVKAHIVKAYAFIREYFKNNISD